LFDVFFASWGEGGPNWRRELVNWPYEEESKWFSPKSPRKSFAQVVKQSPKLVFNRISYPFNYYQRKFASSQPLVSSEKKSIGTSPTPSVQRVLREIPGSLRMNANQHQINPERKSPLHCFLCLARDHRISECRSMVRCKTYFHYGHISCFSKTVRVKHQIYRPKPIPYGGLASQPHQQNPG
jgi:hypothetical protein